jgi:hypothetical protein
MARLAALDAKLARAVEQESKKADDKQHPTTPAVTAMAPRDGFVAPGQVKKPVEKPKPKAKPEKKKAEPQGGSRSSGAATSRPRPKAAEKPSATKAPAGAAEAKAQSKASRD